MCLSQNQIYECINTNLRIPTGLALWLFFVFLFGLSVFGPSRPLLFTFTRPYWAPVPPVRFFFFFFSVVSCWRCVYPGVSGRLPVRAHAWNYLPTFHRRHFSKHIVNWLMNRHSTNANDVWVVCGDQWSRHGAYADAKMTAQINKHRPFSFARAEWCARDQPDRMFWKRKGVR